MALRATAASLIVTTVPATATAGASGMARSVIALVGVGLVGLIGYEVGH